MPVRGTFLVQPTTDTICISMDYQHVDNSFSNDNFQQDWFSQDLPFRAIYHKTAWRNLPGCLLGNEVADDLTKATTSNSVDPENHMVLTSTEIYSRAKEFICRTWVVPPVHPWYFQRHPGSAISFKGSRSYQTAFSRFSTGHLRCMNFEGGKRSFPICPKCNISPFFSSTHSAISGVFLSSCASARNSNARELDKQGQAHSGTHKRRIWCHMKRPQNTGASQMLDKKEGMWRKNKERKLPAEDYAQSFMCNAAQVIHLTIEKGWSEYLLTSDDRKRMENACLQHSERNELDFLKIN
ncbi:RNase H domain-containing protein [Trichonephila clavipes]|nr:RNase H domain-containing protein [Trichonephila clavipes]